MLLRLFLTLLLPNILVLLLILKLAKISWKALVCLLVADHVLVSGYALRVHHQSIG